MTRLLELLMGRLPLGWLQLVNRKGRFASAIAGVAFANLLVFFQLGFLGALGTSVTRPYEALRAEILLSSPAARTLADDETIPRQRMLDALSVPGVEAAAPLFVGQLPIPAEVAGRELVLTLLAMDPAALEAMVAPDIAAGTRILHQAETVLFDRGTRFVAPEALARLEAGPPVAFESLHRTLAIAGTFSLGAGFESDGYAVTSDATFLRLFPNRTERAPNHVLLRLSPGADSAAVLAELRRRLPEGETIARLVAEAAAAERQFQTVERPVGMIFGFGAIMGVLVGLVIVYQVLSTEVSDYLREFATLKAIGYRPPYFRGVVLEQAGILGLAGFFPGFGVSVLLYGLLAGTTGLPLAMTGARVTLVLSGTLLACAASGLLAARRLASADPADLY